MLVEPDQVSGGRIGRQVAVGVQDTASCGAAQWLQRRLRYRGAPMQEPELRVVARHDAPGADMPAPLVGLGMAPKAIRKKATLSTLTIQRIIVKW